MPSWWGIGELADVGFVAKTCLTMSTIDGELSATSRLPRPAAFTHSTTRVAPLEGLDCFKSREA